MDISRTTIVVSPQSIFPAPHQVGVDGKRWFTDVDKIDVVGPILQSRKSSTRAYVGVCGQTSGGNDWGYSV